MSKQDPKHLLEMSECARKAGVSHTTIRHWADSGKLRVAVVTGRGVRLFEQSELDRVIKEREAA